MRTKIFGAALAVVSLVPAMTNATTLTSTFHVTANVVIPSTCTAFNTTDVAFGTLTALQQSGSWVLPQSESQGAITVNCATNLPFTITLNAGTNPTPGNANLGPLGIRGMSNGSSVLFYDLDIPAGCNGNPTSCTSTANLGTCADTGPNAGRWGWAGAPSANQGSLSFVGTGATETIAECGIIYANTPAPPTGAYSDTVVATLTF